MRSRWSPSDRLTLVHALAARPGADSASFFAAHGLASAYERPGRGGSKKSKINSALLEAERRGDVDDILDQARRYIELEGDPIANISTVQEPKGIRRLNKGQCIFLSHASADMQLGDLLQDMLVLGGVPQNRIFYSSARATGIPSGEDFRNYLQNTLRRSALVIELISEKFLQRPVCLMELGGAWALGTSTYPIVIPPLTRDEASKHIGALHMGTLGDSREIDNVFDELNDRITQDVALPLKATAWNNAARRFKSHRTS